MCDFNQKKMNNLVHPLKLKKIFFINHSFISQSLYYDLNKLNSSIKRFPQLLKIHGIYYT